MYTTQAFGCRAIKQICSFRCTLPGQTKHTKPTCSNEGNATVTSTWPDWARRGTRAVKGVVAVLRITQALTDANTAP